MDLQNGRTPLFILVTPSVSINNASRKLKWNLHEKICEHDSVSSLFQLCYNANMTLFLLCFSFQAQATLQPLHFQEPGSIQSLQFNSSQSSHQSQHYLLHGKISSGFFKNILKIHSLTVFLQKQVKKVQLYNFLNQFFLNVFSGIHLVLVSSTLHSTMTHSKLAKSHKS